MVSDKSDLKDPYAAPATWIRLVTFFGMNWLAGVIGFALTPGNSVQSLESQIKFALVFPFYAPGLATYCVGAFAHSLVVFLLVAFVFYICALIHVWWFFKVNSVENWYILCAALFGELILALFGLNLVSSSMNGWT